jgi:hypothetical protein
MAPEAREEARGRPLEDVVELLPDELDDPRVRNRLRKLARDLDELVAEDANGEVLVDRNVLRRIVKDMDGLPEEFKDRIVRESEAHLGKRVKERGKGRPLGWRGLAQHQDAIRPEGIENLQRIGIQKSTPIAEARKILSEHYPEFPAFWLDADAETMRETVQRAVTHNRTWWDCVVSKVGYWAALGIIAVVGAAIIITTATAGWGSPLAIWLISVLGLGTAVIALNCALNPNR